MYKACVFDLDGTLLNSLKDLAISANHALEAQGFSAHEIDEYRYFVGRGVPKLIEATLPEDARTPEILSKTRDLFNGYYDAHYRDYTLPYDGIPELLAELKKLDFKLAVVSNKPQNFTRKLVTEIFGDCFDVVIGAREGLPAKPDPAGAFEACAVMEVRPSRCIYLGDSGVDMLTAKAAGMLATGVLWGFRSRDELLENGALELISHPSEVLKLI